jgi:hypothetical protein
MSGDERARFCQKCQLHVYNLSAMTREQAEELITEKEGKLCVKFFSRSDGTILTTDCPLGVKLVERIRRGLIWVLAGIAAALTLPRIVNWLIASTRSTGMITLKMTRQNPTQIASMSVNSDSSHISNNQRLE